MLPVPSCLSEPFRAGPVELHCQVWASASLKKFLDGPPKQENDLFRALIRVDPVAELGLLPLEEKLERKEIRIPFAWVHKAVEFFRSVYKAHGTEAFLGILGDPEKREVSLGCPSQDRKSVV